MRFEIVVKMRNEEVAHVIGREVNGRYITVCDLDKVAEVEQSRFRISTSSS